MHTHVLIILLLSDAKNAKEPWQRDGAGETVRVLQAGQSWQEPHLVRVSSKSTGDGGKVSAGVLL